MKEQSELIEKLGRIILREKEIVGELNSLFNHSRKVNALEEKEMVSAQIRMLKNQVLESGNIIVDTTEKILMFKDLKGDAEDFEVEEMANAIIPAQRIYPEGISELPYHRGRRMIKPDALEKLALARMKKKVEKVSKKKERKPRRYVKFASKMFHDHSTTLINQGKFKDLSRDLIKANMEFVPAAYVSVIFLNTVVSFFIAILVMLFFLFFSLVALPPFLIPVQESFGIRFIKVFWILFLIPVVTFFFSYIYPYLEKKSIEGRINQEIPFAVIHMSSISSSMIEPSKIFNIIISTKEYPALEKEFIKIQNEINIYGYDLVTALRNRSFNSPSKKLSELFNGLATTINSGGDLPNFFEKRSQSLLFEHKLEKEKEAKASETFMDIYISAVVAAPMILMLLLMMMRISGLGLSLSTGMISLIMILAVSFINILFLAFLQLKQPQGA